MSTFKVIAFCLTIALLTRPIGFIPASILAVIVTLLIGFFQTKSEIDGIELKADSEKASSHSEHNQKALSFTSEDTRIRTAHNSVEQRTPISDSVLVALTFLTAIRQAELAQNQAGVTRHFIFENISKTFKPYLKVGISSQEIEYLNDGINALIECHLAAEQDGKLYWTQGGTVISAYSVAHQQSPTFEEDIKDHKVLDGLLESVNREKRFVPYEQWLQAQPTS